MRFLLIKPEKTGVFCYTNRVDNEPLELEYLSSVLQNAGHEVVIYDRRYNLEGLKKTLKEVSPHVVCMTCYINQENLAKKIVARIKKTQPHVKIIIGGSHVEINYENFFDSSADFLYHISGLQSFMELANHLAHPTDEKMLSEISGICYKKNGKWITTPKVVCSPNDLPLADRRFFYENKKRFNYFIFKELAIVKNAYSCMNSCNFCYCTNLNSGQYACNEVHKLVDEIESIDAENIHITDDNFLSSRAYLEEFIELLMKRKIKKKYLIYGTADFIASNPDLMEKLTEVGLSLVMVGLEAINDKELDSYNKRSSLDQNEICVKVLKDNGIICSGLFIVHPEMTKDDFEAMGRWISNREIIPTISVYTPMKGTKIYGDFENDLITKNTDKQDLFHCILKPKHMSVAMFNLRYRKLLFGLMVTNSLKSRLYKCLNLTDVLFLFKVGFEKLIRIFVF